MYDKVRLLKQKFALEQRIRTLSNPSLTEGKDVTNLLSKMNTMLENVDQQIAELGLPQDQMVSAMPMDNPVLPQQVPVSEYDSHPDHEVQMAKSDLYRAAHSAAALEKMLGHVSEQQGLEGWVQAKITKAADYLESVYHYLDYEMKGGEVDEAVAAFGPGQENPSNTPQGYGAPAQQPPGAPPMAPAKPGQTSPTPPAGGATPGGATPGMVKMSKLDANKKPQGTPIMVKSADIASKQKMGFAVIGESKEEKKVVHCSQCGKGFSASGLKPPHHTGFSHCKDHKGMKVIAEDASGGASSAGGMASSMGNGTGFASGGIGMQKRKKKVGESESGDYGPKARGIADGYYGRPPNPHKIVTDETGKRVRVKLTDPAEVAEYMAGYKDDSFGSKDYGESVEEAGFGAGISTPTMRAKTASKFGHDPDRAAPMYKANKYDPKTGLGGYIAPRGDTTDKSNILLQLKANLDTATGKPLTFQDGSTVAIKPSIARAALAKIDAMRPVEKHETIKNLMTSKDAFVSFVKGQGESKETGPKFTGYWKGKDAKTPGKKMVGDA